MTPNNDGPSDAEVDAQLPLIVRKVKSECGCVLEMTLSKTPDGGYELTSKTHTCGTLVNVFKDNDRMGESVAIILLIRAAGSLEQAITLAKRGVPSMMHPMIEMQHHMVWEHFPDNFRDIPEKAGASLPSNGEVIERGVQAFMDTLIPPRPLPPLDPMVE